MPELPEVQTVVTELNLKLKGKIICSVKVTAPKMVTVGPGTVSNIRLVNQKSVNQFIHLLQGKKILSVKRRAKLLIFDLDTSAIPPTLLDSKVSKSKAIPHGESLSMLVHLKMTGQFIYEDEKLHKQTGGKYRMLNKPYAPLVLLPGKHTHIIFKFTDNSTLYFNDVRKFGYLKLVRDDELGQVKDLQGYGPEPLDKKFTRQLFETAVLKRGVGKIKQVLMDGNVIAGIGNIYSDEILFHAKVLPTRTVVSISHKELDNIYKYIGMVLKKAIQAKGSSVGDFVRTDGTWGQMGKFHYVYGRKGQPCKICGTRIQSLKMNGRTACFCPHCQK